MPYPGEEETSLMALWYHTGLCSAQGALRYLAFHTPRPHFKQGLRPAVIKVFRHQAVTFLAAVNMSIRVNNVADRNYPIDFVGACVLFFCMLGSAVESGASASVEAVTLPNGYVATADYRPGQSGKPAVLVLHGFLSTRNFLTVLNLTNALADSGYTVLAPNLSLGVNMRDVSLACEAIHMHTLADDLAEIDYWITWLVRHGNKNVVLLGHSFGSLQELLYTLEYKNPAVKKLIAASLVDMESEIGAAVSQAQLTKAQALLDRNDNTLATYQVSYCKKYVAPPRAFLSYASWSKQRIVQAISKTSIPVEVILGSNDARMGAGWPEVLRSTGVSLHVIAGANHFFSNEHEFDLLDSVKASLRTVH
jgi:pimeloyl-ACP methyl ester carboxylesterase